LMNLGAKLASENRQYWRVYCGIRVTVDTSRSSSSGLFISVFNE